MLLPFDIRPADDQRQTVKGWINEFEIFEDCVERTAFSSVIEFYFRKPVCIEGDRALPVSRLKKLVFRYKEELGIRIDKAPNEPRASHPVHLDVTARYPFHRKDLLEAPMRRLKDHFPEPLESGELCLAAT